MEIFGFTIARTKALRAPAIPSALVPVSRGRSGWWPIVREPYTGAWQKNDETRVDSVLAYSAVFSCVTLIAADIGKLCLNLVAEDEDGIWTVTENPAFSPLLRKPNRYQNRIKFVEHWITSKLTWGNTYALKQRDARGVVSALYILDPCRVTPLVAPDGAVYYQLNRDDLSGLAPLTEPLTVPAREIIHDRMIALFHPLIGVSPLYACALAAIQGLAIQNNSTRLFQNGAAPGGILTAPGAIDEESAKRVKDYWEANYTGANVGKVAVVGDGLKYESVSMNAVDAQLIDQLKWTGETVCSCFHVPPYMIAIGPPPPYANIEPLLQQYYSQCIQSLLSSFELCLDEGIELPRPYGTEFDIDDLIWMDTATKTKAAADAITSGGMSPNEARAKYYGLGPVEGGDTPYLQQQMYSLAALAQRDENDPFAKPRTLPPNTSTAPPDGPPEPPPPDEQKDFMGRFLASMGLTDATA